MSDVVSTEVDMPSPNGQSKEEGQPNSGGGQNREDAGKPEAKKYTFSRVLLERRLEKLRARSEARGRGENPRDVRSSEEITVDEEMEKGKIAMALAGLESGAVGPAQELILAYYEENLLTTEILGVVEKEAEKLAQTESATGGASVEGVEARVRQLTELKQVTRGDREAMGNLKEALEELGVEIARLNKAEEEARAAIEQNPEALGAKIADVEVRLGRNKLAGVMTRAHADHESLEAKQVDDTIQQAREVKGRTGNWKDQSSTHQGLVDTAVTVRQLGTDVGLSLLGWFWGEFQRQTNEAVRKM